MEYVLYSLEHCPFCKHFRRLFLQSVPNGKEVILGSHMDPIWVEKKLEFVPTVIAYDNGVEVDRLGAVGMVGIRKQMWDAWLEKRGMNDLNN